MPYEYFIGSLITLAFWMFLFAERKDLRREMLTVSAIATMVSLVLMLTMWDRWLWLEDWWHPKTITGTPFGLEDLIYNFGVAGVAAVVFPIVFRKKLYAQERAMHETRALAFLIALSIGLLVISIFIRVHSFPATLMSLTMPALLLLKKRPDLILDSLASGLIMAILGLFGFLIIQTLNPNFVQQTYFLGRLSGIQILGYPVEDIAWYFAVGVLMGPIYAFWKNARLVKAKPTAGAV